VGVDHLSTVSPANREDLDCAFGLLTWPPRK
jgi:hypothetical protein